jgi:hypothetical protein
MKQVNQFAINLFILVSAFDVSALRFNSNLNWYCFRYITTICLSFYHILYQYHSVSNIYVYKYRQQKLL